MNLNVNFLDTFRVLKSSFIEFWPKFEKIRKITAFQALVDFLTKLHWSKSRGRQICYEDHFQSLKYSKLVPVFTLNYFSIFNDDVKMAYLKAVRYVTNFRTLRHLICSLQLEYFSHQSSLAVLNVNPSLFHYIMQKMIWYLEKAYFDGRYITLKNPHTFFFSKIKYT